MLFAAARVCAQDNSGMPAVPATPSGNITAPDENVLSALTKPLGAVRVDKKPVSDVVATLTKQSGILVVADSTISAKPVSFSVTSLPVTELAVGLARLLPGTVVRLIAVPADLPSPDADILTQLVGMQDMLLPSKKALTGAKGEPTIESLSEIDIGGRYLPISKASPVLTALKMRPALLLTNPTSDNPVAKSARLQAEGLQVYLGMSPEQRVQAAERQMESLLNMDSATRRALFGQMQEQGMAVMKKLNSLPPDQRAQFFRDLTNDKFDGTTPPAKTNAGSGNGH